MLEAGQNLGCHGPQAPKSEGAFMQMKRAAIADCWRTSLLLSAKLTKGDRAEQVGLLSSSRGLSDEYILGIRPEQNWQ